MTEDFQGTIEAKVGGETVRDSIQTLRLKEEAPYTLRYNRQEDTTDDLYHRRRWIPEKNTTCTLAETSRLWRRTFKTKMSADCW